VSCHFQASPGVDAEMLGTFLLAQTGMRPEGVRRIERWYLDTFDHRLAQAGWAIEADSPSQHLPVVHLRRLGTEQQDQLHGLTSPPKLATDIPRPRLRNRLINLTEGRALLPVSAGHITVHAFDCLDARGKLTARFLIETSSELPASTVLRVQAITGFERVGQRVIRAARRAGLVKPLREDCSLFWLKQLGRAPAQYRPKPIIALRAEQGSARALAKLLRAYTHVMQTNEAGIVADLDSEFLHDYRVALRSIRSWLGDLKSTIAPELRARFRAELSTLNRATGALRDMDVLGGCLDAYLAACPEVPPAAAAALRQRVQSTREAARAALKTHLLSAEYQAAMQSWGEFLDALGRGKHAGRRGRSPVLNTVSRALRKRRLAILRFDPDEARHDPETLHELRKDCKKLRYLLEGFQRLFEPEALQRAVRELKTLQSAMGDTWDLHVHHELLQRLVQGDSSESAPDPGALQLLTTLGERLGSLERKHVALVDAAFARFRAPRVQRLYARLEENRT